jgi:hypothetical protein
MNNHQILEPRLINQCQYPMPILSCECAIKSFNKSSDQDAGNILALKIIEPTGNTRWIKRAIAFHLPIPNPFEVNTLTPPWPWCSCQIHFTHGSIQVFARVFEFQQPRTYQV